MKREAINSTEGQLNEDGLVPLVGSMLECRQMFADGINDMFGTDISVELSGAWRARQEQFKAMADQADQILEGGIDEENTDNNREDTGRNTAED